MADPWTPGPWKVSGDIPNDANRRLMEAAPELVAALEALLDNGHSYESEGQCRDAARALLARIRNGGTEK